MSIPLNKKKVYPWYFALGALLLYSLLYVLPGIIGIGYSFTDWSSYSNEINFVGLDNFKLIFSPEEDFTKYIGNTLLFTVVTTTLKTVLALAFALVLSHGVKLKNFHRGIMYMPSVLSVLIVGLLFKSILNPSKGMLNEFFRAIGMDFMAQKWLTDPKIAFWSVMGVDVWRGVGYIMTILIVGILAISPTYYEAADIDGVNGWQRFRYITLPLLKPTLSVTIVLNVLYGLKVFDMVYALTNGGPGHATEVMYTSVYAQFSLGRYGVGTAVSSLMFVFMVIIGFFMIRVLTRNEVQE